MAFKRLFIAILLTVSANIGSAKTALLLVDPVMAFNSRIDLINKAGAGDTIELAYYIVKDDQYGLTLFDSLFRAADRGAKVRFIIDDIQSRVSAPLLAMTELYPSFQVKIFRPFPSYNPRTVGRRLHDKFLILNRNEVLFGGRNISKEYFSPDTTWIDSDVLLEGTVAADASDYFDRIWNFKASKKAKYGSYKYKTPEMLNIFKQCKNDEAPSRCLSENKKALKEEYFRKCYKRPKKSKSRNCTPKFKSFLDGHTQWWKAREDIAETQDSFLNSAQARKRDYAVNKVPYDSAIWLNNFSNVSDWKRGVPEDSLSGVMYKRIANAKNRAWSTAPYLIATKALRRAYEKADAKTNSGLDIRVVTNSPSSTDSMIVTIASMGKQKKLERSNAKILRRADNEFLHSKMTVIDEDIVIVSSHNMDPRSEKLNSESGALIISYELSAQTDIFFDNLFSTSWYDDPDRKNRKNSYKKTYNLWDHLMHHVTDKVILNIPGAEAQL